MKITIFPEKCVGVGQCVIAAPKIFSQNDDDGQVILLTEDFGPSDYQDIRAAARLCPASAILVED